MYGLKKAISAAKLSLQDLCTQTLGRGNSSPPEEPEGSYFRAKMDEIFLQSSVILVVPKSVLYHTLQLLQDLQTQRYTLVEIIFLIYQSFLALTMTLDLIRVRQRYFIGQILMNSRGSDESSEVNGFTTFCSYKKKKVRASQTGYLK